MSYLLRKSKRILKSFGSAKNKKSGSDRRKPTSRAQAAFISVLFAGSETGPERTLDGGMHAPSVRERPDSGIQSPDPAS